MGASKNDKAKESQLVSFKLGSEEYGVDIIKVQEIIKVQDITRVPRAPDYVEGVVNLRGNVLPIIDTRKRFGMDPTQKQDSTRIIVADINGTTIGMVVDSVSEVLRVEGKDIEPPPPIIANSDADYMMGIGKLNQGKRLISLLDLERVLKDDETNDELSDLVTSDEKDARHSASDRTIDHEAQFVSFHLGQEEYAIDIDLVEEIIRIPEITSIPDVPDYIKGVISLRGKVIPVLSLRRRFNLEENYSDDDDRTRILVVHANVDKDTQEGSDSDQSAEFGIIVDMVNEVLSVPVKFIEPPPNILSSSGTNHLVGVGKLENGSRLLLILNVGEIFNNMGADDSDKNILQRSSLMDSREGEDVMDEKQMVIFRIGNEEFGISIMNIQEIIRMTDITEIPGTPYFVEGVVNLRGAVLPVIDLRKRFGLGAKDKTDSNRIVVVNHKGAATGIIVDSVSEVLQMSSKEVEPPPPVVSGINSSYIEGIGKLNKGNRFIIVLNLPSILNPDGYDDSASADSKSEKHEEYKTVEADISKLEEMVDEVVAEIDEGAFEVVEVSSERSAPKKKPARPRSKTK